MSESKLPYFLCGLGIGAALGILYAPRSGEETREELRHRANEGRDYVRRRAGEGREYVRERAGETVTGAAPAGDSTTEASEA